MKIRLLLAVLILTSITQPIGFAAGRVEHHQLTSRILADQGESGERELSVYLPEGYHASGQAYPVLYLISGTTGTNRTFLGLGYRGIMTNANAQEIVDGLINDRRIKPLIVVFPHVGRDRVDVAPFDAYLAQEIVPFVDANYRTISRRQGRAISGHSRGGHDALHIALKYPQLFSLVGGHAAGALGGGALPARNVLAAHNQNQLTLHFWLSVGKNDSQERVQLNRDFVKMLQELNLPHVFVEDDGNHVSMVPARLADSVVFFSEKLSSGP